MTGKTLRKIVRIDAEKCNGCGACATKCAEGAIQIVDGKAILISDQYCDGLGACLGECPEGAITIAEREAEEFSEAAVHEHRHGREAAPLPCGCLGSSVRQLEHEADSERTCEHIARASQLTHWPVQLTLVPPDAPFLKGADVLLAADCVGFAHPGFNEDFLRDHVLLVACPKLDDLPAHLAKLTQIVRQARPKSLTVVHMEVPCCSGLLHMARQAIAAAGAELPLKEVMISVRGRVLQESACA